MNRNQIILQEISGTSISLVNGKYVFRVFDNADEHNRYQYAKKYMQKNPVLLDMASLRP